MSQTPIFLRVEETLADAYEKMSNHSIRHLPVLNRSDQVVGIFTQTDLNRAHSPRQTEEGWWYYDKDELRLFAASHFMSKEPITLTTEHNLKDAIDIMAREKFSCIPIVDPASKKLCGIITIVDVLRQVASIL